MAAFGRSVRNICTKRVIIPTVVWLAYLSFGAFMFSRIEGQRETDHDDNEERWLKQLIAQTIKNTTNAADVDLNEPIIVDFVDKIIDRYHPERRNYKWDMAGGAHFCLTVVSTIGYGLIVPRTQIGRAVCVIYAMFGIPINIIFMAGIGRVIARLIDRTYCLCLGVFSHCPCYKRQPKADESNDGCSDKPLQVRHNAWSNQVNGAGAGVPDPAGAAKDKQQCNILKDTRDKVTRSSMFHVLYSDWSKQPETSFTGSTLPEDRVADGLSGDAKSSCDNKGEKADGSDMENLMDDPKDSASPLAPFWFVILFVLLITTILTIGIWYSGILKDNWTLIDLIYFKFITFSTIGFGDLFINTPTGVNRHLTVFADILIIVVGMSLLSTVLNVITSSNRLDQALNFVTCLLQTMWQYVSGIYRRDRI